MANCQVTRYKFSYWGKGFNHGKINIALDTNEGRTLLLENVTPEHAVFLLDMLRKEKDILCDPDSPDSILSAGWADVGWMQEEEN
ncbi:MAG TPA: hypothetical protein VJ965_02440 [Anaerolineales bacterium]|nr:hypothetical protein [Anaerolineales bacterium]